MTNNLNISRFESLGDNCEFGFVKRSLEDESGGLLRWATSPPDVLIEGLKNRFAGLYEYENLTPSWNDMVRDSAYGFCFHTKMISEEQKWLQTDEERRAIHSEEKRKVDYLVGKLLTRLQDPNVICVYKCNDSISTIDAKSLAKCIADIGPSTLLVVRKTKDENLIGKVFPEKNYLCGFVDNFAPYDKADSFTNIWLSILENSTLLPPCHREGKIKKIFFHIMNLCALGKK